VVAAPVSARVGAVIPAAPGKPPLARATAAEGGLFSRAQAHQRPSGVSITADTKTSVDVRTRGPNTALGDSTQSATQSVKEIINKVFSPGQ